MQLQTFLLSSALSLSYLLAAPVQTPPDPLTACDIEAIAPSTATCDGAPFPAECADSERAAPSINLSFEKYGIKSLGEQAALVSLMLFESGNFTYNKNHFPEPGNPGQGTKNMQSPAYNREYAAYLFGEEAAAAAEAQGPDAVLALVSGDEESFGSAAWFLNTQCDAQIREGLATETEEGWRAHLEKCVETSDPDGGRKRLWEKTLEVMKGQ